MELIHWKPSEMCLWDEMHLYPVELQERYYYTDMVIADIVDNIIYKMMEM